jgi:hypothetical protein
LEVVVIAGAWNERSFKQEEESYEGGRLEVSGISVEAWLYSFLFLKISFPPCTCYHASIQASRLQCVYTLTAAVTILVITKIFSYCTHLHVTEF